MSQYFVIYDHATHSISVSTVPPLHPPSAFMRWADREIAEAERSFERTEKMHAGGRYGSH